MDQMKAESRNWFKDFGNYAGWFVIWGALFASAFPVTAARLNGTSFWAVKADQALLGAGFGIVCALTFTLLQNGFNRARTKSISWIFAIGSWAVISMCIALASELFNAV